MNAEYWPETSTDLLCSASLQECPETRMTAGRVNTGGDPHPCPPNAKTKTHFLPSNLGSTTPLPTAAASLVTSSCSWNEDSIHHQPSISCSVCIAFPSRSVAHYGEHSRSEIWASSAHVRIT